MLERAKYKLEKAQEEATKMQAKIKNGEVKNYTEAEKLVEAEKKEFWEKEMELQNEILNRLKEKYKISELPHKGGTLEEQLIDIRRKFGSLKNVKGKRILDLGCGSNYGSFDSDVFNKLASEKGEVGRTFEPWLCRALLELGADPVGIDIGNLEDEKFENYQIDLSKKGALDFLPSKSFDGISMRVFLDSPQLENMVGNRSSKQKDEGYFDNIKDVQEELLGQIDRLLKEDGKRINEDSWVIN